ncbi:MAG: DAK2 domain-containing protein [Lachnospiraceae bacterium]|nr:DAK2 domain-containing protein [Lachnospiraceae bacterium]
MKTKRLNGLQFEGLLRNGLNNLKQFEEEINRLNVFPVPDGDTGTNMRLTLEHGMETARSTTEIGAYLKALSDGMLLGARGNSGVILSQIFRGVFQELSRAGSVSAADLRNAFIRGYRVAYSAVARPVEGTMLTVAREGVESIRNQIGRSSFIEDFFSLYTAEMNKSLAHTPDMLPVLKEAGVVDSGGKGLVLIIEGMLKGLYGETVSPKSEEKPEADAGKPAEQAGMPIKFDENTKMKDGYCVEFILQLMNGRDYRQDFNEKRFTETLEALGNSTVVVRNEKLVKVHVHVMKPSLVFRFAEKYGEFVTVKVENMQIQHNEHLEKLGEEKKEIVKDLAVIAVANSPETADLFRGLGADLVLEGGDTMNTSAEEFVRAFRKIDAKKIVVLPDNKNIVPAAEQAAQLDPETAESIVVLPTRNIAEGYYALASDVPDSADLENRVEAMRRGAERLTTLSVTKSVRDCQVDGVICRKGDYIVIRDGEMIASDPDEKTAVLAGLSSVEEMDTRDALVVFLGEDTSPEKASDLEEWVADAYPMVEVSFLESRQPVYEFIFGIV